MSIQIRKDKCVGCGRCIEACPGNLIKRDADGLAFIRHTSDCWGCTSCMKECRTGAIRFFLGADIGGRGSALAFCEKGNISIWRVESPKGRVQTIELDKTDANRY